MYDSSSDTLRHLRQLTATGIKIDFYSDTETLNFAYTAYVEYSSQLYKLYYFDIYADDALVLHQGEKDVTTDKTSKISLKLKEGHKRITIYLPGSCAVKITDFTIDDGAVMQKIEYDKNVLFFGDSITHAAYLDYPSLSYANVISNRLNYNCVNLAIGGDIFDKVHLTYLSDFNPDIIYIIIGSTLRSRTPETKARILAELVEKVFPKIETGEVKPTILAVLPIQEAEAAHDILYKGKNVGKVVLEVK